MAATSPCQIDLSLSGAAIAARTAVWGGHIGPGLSSSSEITLAHPQVPLSSLGAEGGGSRSAREERVARHEDPAPERVTPFSASAD